MTWPWGAMTLIHLERVLVNNMYGTQWTPAVQRKKRKERNKTVISICSIIKRSGFCRPWLLKWSSRTCMTPQRLKKVVACSTAMVGRRPEMSAGKRRGGATRNGHYWMREWIIESHWRATLRTMISQSRLLRTRWNSFESTSSKVYDIENLKSE